MCSFVLLCIKEYSYVYAIHIKLICQNALHRIILMSSIVSFLLYKSLISMLKIEHPDKFDEVIYYKYRLLIVFK